jgi:hypothetical protein
MHLDMKQPFWKNLLASLFVAFLMLPTAIQLFHISEGHQHITCTKKAIHVHKSISECDLCDFHMSPLTYEIDSFSDLIQIEISVKLNIDFPNLHLPPFNVTNTRLRAPPIFS